jgi:HlyD family secretion protein
MQHDPDLTPSWRPQSETRRPGRLGRLLLVLVLCAASAAGGVVVSSSVAPSQAQKAVGPSQAPKVEPAVSAPQPEPAAIDTPRQKWVAAAPGRVEPRSGQTRIGTGIAGRVQDISAGINDRVTEGGVLMRLDDKEARARLTAAEAELAVRQRERDAQPGTAGREEVRKAEDAVFEAERAVTNARFALDAVLAGDEKSSGSPRGWVQARNQMAQAKEKLRQEQSAFAAAHAKARAPAPNRLETALIAARTEVTMAEEMLDKTRIRAPITGSVLQVNVKLGELVAPSPESPLIVMGDLTLIRVRAEVDEQDVAKIKLGQAAFVRSNAYPGRDFDAKVTELAPSLGIPRMGSRGARRATDVEVMEVMLDLEGSVPLLSGMRADVFFR